MSEGQYYYSQQRQQCLILRGFEGPTTEACSGDYNQHLFITSRAGEASGINRLVGVGPSDSVNVIQGRQGGVAAGLVEAAVGDVATVDPFLLLLLQVAVIAAVYLLLGW